MVASPKGVPEGYIKITQHTCKGCDTLVSPPREMDAEYLLYHKSRNTPIPISL